MRLSRRARFVRILTHYLVVTTRNAAILTHVRPGGWLDLREAGSSLRMHVSCACRQAMEKEMRKNIGMIGAALCAAGLLAAPAHAAGVKVGTLTCNVESGWGYILGSQKDLSCVLTSVNGKESRYTGDITKLGIDVGYTKGGTMIWTVVAPSKDLQEDALEGTYGGVTAGATAVVGGNLNVLVGGLDKSITLQPISVEGNNGLSITAGVGAMQLRHEHNL